MLENLQPDQLTEVLSQAGIDPASLADFDVTQLIEQVSGAGDEAAGASDGIAGFIGGFFNR